MSRKMVNVITGINILVGTLLFIIFGKFRFELLKIPITETSFTKYTVLLLLVLLFCSIAGTISILRQETRFKRKFHITKNSLQILIILPSIVLIGGFFVLIFSFLLKDYIIKVMEVSKSFPYVQIANSISYILIYAFFIALHFRN